MPRIVIDDLQTVEKAHWQLHLNAVVNDTPAVSREVRDFLQGRVDLPNIRHPGFIHDWLEHPEERPQLEQING